jgi:membrane fusion protein, heavy metal efflux system
MSEPEVKSRARRAVEAALALSGVAGAAVALTLFLDHRYHAHGGEHAGHDHHDEGAKGHGHHEKPGADAGHAAEEGRVKLGPEALANAELEVLVAAPATIDVTLALSGELAVNAERLAHVTPRVAGTVREVKKQLGDEVRKGDVLAILDSRDLAEMQRNALAAREKLELTEANYRRQEALFKEKISAEKDFLAAKQAYAEARIEARSADQKLAASGGAGQRVGGSGYALLAPLDGTILEKHIGIGEVMKDDTQAFVIADLSTLWVNVTVYAKDLVSVRSGQRASVRVEGIREVATGSIDFLGQVVADQSRSAKGRIVLANPGPSWRPGLFATAEVAVASVDAAVVVSSQALQSIAGKDAVFVQEADGAFRVRAVKLGRRGRRAAGIEEAVEIAAGLRAGERYVAKNSFVLKAELGKSEAGHEH